MSDFGYAATSRRAPSGRRTQIDDGSDRSHTRVQCERRAAGWLVTWPLLPYCPTVRAGDDWEVECTCAARPVATFEHALAVIRERVAILEGLRS